LKESAHDHEFIEQVREATVFLQKPGWGKSVPNIARLAESLIFHSSSAMQLFVVLEYL
jgi:hypothetical protein